MVRPGRDLVEGSLRRQLSNLLKVKNINFVFAIRGSDEIMTVRSSSPGTTLKLSQRFSECFSVHKQDVPLCVWLNQQETDGMRITYKFFEFWSVRTTEYGD